MRTGGRVGPPAGAEFDFAFVEVLLEFDPFGVGGRSVFLGRAHRAAPLQVGLVVPDERAPVLSPCPMLEGAATAP